MNKTTLFLLTAVIFLFGTAALVSFAVPDVENVTISEVKNICNGVVVSAPKELKAGIYVMDVEVERSAKQPISLMAITSHPEQFYIGDTIELYSVIQSPKA